MGTPIRKFDLRLTILHSLNGLRSEFFWCRLQTLRSTSVLLVLVRQEFLQRIRTPAVILPSHARAHSAVAPSASRLSSRGARPAVRHPCDDSNMDSKSTQ